MRTQKVRVKLSSCVFSNNDHRIAMSLAVLGLFSKNPIEVTQPDAVKKSYPGFWRDLEGLKQ